MYQYGQKILGTVLTCLQFFLFTKCTMAFQEFGLSDLLNLWQVLISLTSISQNGKSVKTDVTDYSCLSFETDPGIQLNTKFFH